MKKRKFMATSMIVGVLMGISFEASSQMTCPQSGTVDAKCKRESGPAGEYVECTTMTISTETCKFTPPEN